MELYLDSVDFKEIEEAVKLGTLSGLTTTPTFMHRHGITDIDGTILKLAKMVPVLQVEALGDNADEVYKEAHRLLALGLKKETTVFKIPVSIEAIKACKRLTDEGIMVNIHLVYTLQQAYMAAIAGATYVCPLVGRLQDQGYDALALIKQCVDMVNHYGYKSKIMFSSVRHAEHVRNAITLGVHTCTIPWSVMKNLTENNLTKLGTQQFIEHTRLVTIKVGDVLRDVNSEVDLNDTVTDAIVRMTESGMGAVAVIDANRKLAGVFTDGDLRRHLKDNGKAILQQKMADISYKSPLTVSADALLIEAVDLFKKHRVDNLIVTQADTVVGMLDIQDLVKMNLIG
jgi:transaldolase